MVLETERLILRKLSFGDAPFILELLNEPAFIRFIGDKGVRNLDDARAYLKNGPMLSYKQHGFGLYMTALKDRGIPLGICGLVKRDTLPDADIGFAFLRRHRNKGYATESARAVLAHAVDTLKIPRIVGITAQDNHGSIKVLQKIGLKFDTLIDLPGFEEQRKFFVPANTLSKTLVR